MDAIDLLEALGRDCVGAVQLLALDAPPPGVRGIEAETLTEAQVERLLDHTVANDAAGLVGDGALRIAIAGAQEKTALLRHEGQWCRPLGATPTTHILKLPLGEVGGMRANFSTSVENEWLCARIAQEFGLPVARSDIATVGRHRVLVVERFDRKLLADKWWARLPQEDFCQALGVPPEHKYEADGGPGISAILDVLRGSDTPLADRLRFLQTQLLFWMLAAPDGHAKNFSIFLNAGGRYRLTPLYDIMSAWPVIGNGPRDVARQKVKLAMNLLPEDANYSMNDVRRRHWDALAKTNAVGEDFAAAIAHVAAVAPSAADAVAKQLPPEFPASVSNPVLEGLLAQAALLS